MKTILMRKKKTKRTGINPLTKWLSQLSVGSKFYVITGSIIIILLFSLGSFWFGMKVMSSIRAYVEGEGLWSKAQKEATSNLMRYSDSFDVSDYNNFISFLQVPLGDKIARLELEKTNPDLSVVSQGFIQGENNPNDINDMSFLYRRFRHVNYIDKAIQIWTSGDAGIIDLLAVGDKIHSIISSAKNTGNPNEKALIISQISPLIKQAYYIDAQLTVQENAFSSTLGDGSRNIKDMLLWIIFALTLFLGMLAIFIASFIARIVIEVDKAKTEFVSLASHQLRTPPTSMKWFLDMLRSGEVGTLNPKQQEYFNEVYENNQRMIVLTDMLLNASKIELGVFKVAPELTDISKLVDIIIKEYQPRIQSKKLILQENYDPDLPLVLVDPKLLYIVLQNIILNSIKYSSHEGKIAIDVSLNRKNDNVGGNTLTEDSAIVKISDNGYGIPRNEYDKIFSKLYRASNVKKKETDGTGLGLYLSKSIMDYTRGGLWFESELNFGTTFYVAIPIKGPNKRTGAQELITGHTAD